MVQAPRPRSSVLKPRNRAAPREPDVGQAIASSSVIASVRSKSRLPPRGPGLLRCARNDGVCVRASPLQSSLRLATQLGGMERNPEGKLNRTDFGRPANVGDDIIHYCRSPHLISGSGADNSIHDAASHRPRRHPSRPRQSRRRRKDCAHCSSLGSRCGWQAPVGPELVKAPKRIRS